MRSAVRIGLFYLKPRQVAFIRAVGPYAASSQQAWNDMFAWMTRNKLDTKTGFGYGLALDHADPVGVENRRYDACIDLPSDFTPNKNDGLALQTLPGGAFARFRHVGPYEGVGSVIGKVRDAWLASQDTLVVDRRRPLLVVYLDNRLLQTRDKQRCDVCIPVRTHHEDVYARTQFSDMHAHETTAGFRVGM